jgi:hypothetical protein
MKKLNKLGINSEKIMKNDELVTLRGGYGEANCCLCMNGAEPLGVMAFQSSPLECTATCVYTYEPPYENVWGQWNYEECGCK